MQAKYQRGDEAEYEGVRVQVVHKSYDQGEWWYKIIGFDTTSAQQTVYIARESELSDWSEFDDAATLGNVARFLAHGEYDKAEQTLRELPPDGLVNASRIGTMLDNFADMILHGAKVG